MRFLQPLLKLALVGVLVCLILSRPHSVRADGYLCDAQWTQDYSNLTQWMNQCMVCTHQGTPNYQVCYTLDYPIQDSSGDTVGYSSYQTCNEVNESAQQCVNDCAYGFNQQFQQYFAADCPPA